MTTFGRILVLVNLVLSVSVMVWALGLYANRIDWSDQKGRADQPPGELAKRQARIDELVNAIRPAEAAWAKPRTEILALEKQRSGDRAWYLAEVEQMRSSATAANPARRVVYDRGIPALD